MPTRQEVLQAARQEMRRRLAEKPKRVAPDPPPRYDEVFHEGTRWLDGEAGEPLSPSSGGPMLIAEHDDRMTAGAARREALRRRFEEYAEEWSTRTAHLSVLSQRMMHPSYQRIIGLGPDALPLILERLATHPDHWFRALGSIAGEDPVSREDAGNFAAMRDAWIRWGRDRGLI